MFTELFNSLFQVMLKFDWQSFFGGAKEVVDIIWASLSENYGQMFQK